MDNKIYFYGFISLTMKMAIRYTHERSQDLSAVYSIGTFSYCTLHLYSTRELNCLIHPAIQQSSG